MPSRSSCRLRFSPAPGTGCASQVARSAAPVSVAHASRSEPKGPYSESGTGCHFLSPVERLKHLVSLRQLVVHPRAHVGGETFPWQGAALLGRQAGGGPGGAAHGGA